MTALLGAAALAQHTLLVASIENVHYVQYALLPFLLGRSGMSIETTRRPTPPRSPARSRRSRP